MTADGIVELDRRAVEATVEVVSQVTAADLDRPTPCADWALGELLAHMTAQHYGFAAAAEGDGGDLGVWQVRPLGTDPVAAYTEAAGRVIAAFAEPGVTERKLELPEVLPGHRFPGAQAISFHFIDYVVHGWDVARTIGAGYEPGADLVQAALPIAQAVPGGKARLRPGAAFGPGLPVDDDAPPLDTILALLGRSPSWPS
jgi:uncharacterized protein (TIGR03086 family)